MRVISVYEIIWMGESYIKKGMIWPLFYTAVFYLVVNGILTLLFRWPKRSWIISAEEGSAMPVLEVKNIEKHFGATRVLEGHQLRSGAGPGPGHHRVVGQRQDPPCCAA